MKGYYMMITVKEDRMGNLHLAPVSEKHSQDLTAMHNQTKVFAQEGMQFQSEILERLPENAIKNMQGDWTATTRVPIVLFYHWVAFCAWERDARIAEATTSKLELALRSERWQSASWLGAPSSCVWS